MYSKNPYTRSAFKQNEPSFQPYPHDDYYYQPQPPPYYQQSPPPYYEQPYPPYYQQPQPSFYEQPYPPYHDQPYPPYHDQPYPPYQTSLPRKSFAESSRPFSNYYEGDGMITDIEYLDFPADKTYKRTPLNQRSHNKITNIKKQSIQTIKFSLDKNPVTIFFTVLLEQLNTERQIEELKRKLVIAQDFNLPQLFQIIDKNQTQNITFDELFQGFQEIGLKVDYNQLFLVYTRFSEFNSIDRMSLQEFEHLFLPLGQTSKQQKRQNTLLGPQTKSNLNELIKLYQTNELRFENARSLLQRESIDIQQIYQMIDVNQSRNIGLNEFMNALNLYSAVKVVPSEAALLFMRFDRSRNGTISFMEFKREMELKLS
ncbi:unnamed protein product (macronuclear) [Paramecium tetraurelia]|uniref:EF-hand domain-containing protein n=1 Tax=Paramecium tetraurelia TaxID=5888 RepID=A0D0W9_PARTE|nr:uncharacterized protein GSPATT00012238001 [Paramecium tetraurelia]CAK76686.1 unnamed protein product [Paramecium tetraurelia]|eukprot:XP_001444083.1 hypothetical protein (macronuclear) [Paramecium tetraurelia strain d4-2]